MMMSAGTWARSLGAVLLTVGLAAPPQARAQLARPRTVAMDAPKLLVVPFNREQQDSVLSLLVADAVRERLRTAHSIRFNTLSRQNICDNLTQSGFPCDVPLETGVIRTLANFLNTRYVAEGWMVRNGGDSMRITVRFYERVGQPPQGAMITVTVPVARVNNGVGNEIANQIARAHRAFEDVVECREALEQRNYNRAMQRAMNSVREFPANSGAHLCMAQVHRAQNAPRDSVIAHLRLAAAADSLNAPALRMLAAEYEHVADTASMVETLTRILSIERDADLRVRTIRLFVQLGRNEQAIALANQGLAGNLINVELMQAKAIAFAAMSRWDSAASTLQHVSEVDTAAVDSAFVFRLTNYLRQIPDSVSLFSWVRRATQRFPSQAPYWYELSNLAIVNGDTNLAMTAAQQYIRLMPTDGRGHFALARVQIARGMYDSALAHIQALAQDSSLRQFAAPLLVPIGGQMLRDSNYTRAAEILGQARQWGTGRSQITAAYFQGVALIQLGVRADNEAQNSRNCEVARRSEQNWNEAEQAIIAGAAQDRQQANRFLTEIIPAFKQRAAAMIQNFCR